MKDTNDNVINTVSSGYLNDLARKCHATSVSKGWYENERSTREFLQLMSSELAEASEEARNRNPFVWYTAEDGSKIAVTSEGVKTLNLGVMTFKPEGEGTELVDAAIRMLDWAAFRKLTLITPEQLKQIGVESDDEKLQTLRPLEFHFDQNVILAQFVNETNGQDQDLEGVSILASIFLLGIMSYIQTRGYDFLELVKLKDSYNTTRSHRHGGKAL